MPICTLGKWKSGRLSGTGAGFCSSVPDRSGKSDGNRVQKSTLAVLYPWGMNLHATATLLIPRARQTVNADVSDGRMSKRRSRFQQFPEFLPKAVGHARSGRNVKKQDRIFCFLQHIPICFVTQVCAGSLRHSIGNPHFICQSQIGLDIHGRIEQFAVLLRRPLKADGIMQILIQSKQEYLFVGHRQGVDVTFDVEKI